MFCIIFVGYKFAKMKIENRKMSKNVRNSLIICFMLLFFVDLGFASPQLRSGNFNVEVHLPEFENAEVRYPELSGGCIRSFFLRNTRYPIIAQENNIQGRVIVSFVVEIDGTTSNLCFKGSADFLLEREVMMVIRRTSRCWAPAVNDGGKWTPAMKNGEKIPMEIKLEFNFYLPWLSE